MDEYISEFLYSNYDDSNNHRKLLSWLIIDKNNKASKINSRLKYSVDSQNIFENTKFHRNLARYKTFYELYGRRQRNGTVSNKKIKSLQIGNFRGFGQLSEEDKGVKFYFNKINNIFFAPNGGGKSSLCEAIEFQTTGEIKEAARRKTNLKNYIKRDGKHNLILLDFDDRVINSVSDYKFNFIDRNRLQEFSLLGSSDTNFKERDVLAALVGLEAYDSFLSLLVSPRSFNAISFVSNQNLEIINGLKIKLQRYRNASIENFKELQEIRIRILNELGYDTKNLSKRYFDDVIRTKRLHLKKYLSKLNDKKSQLKKGIPSIELPFNESIKIINSLAKTIDRKERIECKLKEIVYDEKTIALHKLSKALLEDKKNNHCPLCNTPIEKVSKNPLENSVEILNSFVNVTNLQKCLSKHITHIEKLSAIILGSLRSFLISPINTNIEVDFSKLHEISNIFEKMNDVGLKNALFYFEELLKNCTTLSLYNEKTAQHNSVIKNIDSNLKSLNKKIDATSSSIENIDNLRAVFISKQQNKEKKKIAFYTLLQEIYSTNIKLIDEESKNNFIKGLPAEYEHFYNQAYDFKRVKESEILSGIESSIVHYYNEINKHDDNSEKLDSLSFVFDTSLNSYRIELKINKEKVDAFVQLSEGHLKSLGLSILLALAKKKNSQFIIFDDVVNAIDTEHRSNIINTFLTDPYIKKAQKIITTHDKLFWELYSNRQKSLGNGEFSSFILSCFPHGIHYEERDISFEGKISDSLEYYDIRQALIYCRIWFESLASQYCVESGLSITASFSSRDYQKPNLIKISLEKMYAALTASLEGKLENLNYIKSNFLSWSVQNQEHHAFSENNYNIVHSKTSQEIQMIFDCIRKFEIQLAPEKRLQSLNDRLDALDVRILSCDNRIQRATQATPLDVIRQWNNDKAKYSREKIKTQELKSYCENLLL